MIFSGHLTTSKLSKPLKMPSPLHQCFLTSISISQPACAQMLVDMAWALYSNRTQQVRTWNLIQAGSRFLTDSEAGYAVIELLYAGLSPNASFYFQDCNISRSSQTTTPLFRSLTIIALMKSKTHVFKD